ncbi:uncharacterized protein V1510DRAFT_405435 [Dipodascopsis tothii]|uniref:uncharacterized protein n=1 Tax=Dipodascopsis tothii TaxID=44089 RepID=UPI0034CE53DB
MIKVLSRASAGSRRRTHSSPAQIALSCVCVSAIMLALLLLAPFGRSAPAELATGTDTAPPPRAPSSLALLADQPPAEFDNVQKIATPLWRRRVPAAASSCAAPPTLAAVPPPRRRSPSKNGRRSLASPHAATSPRARDAHDEGPRRALADVVIEPPLFAPPDNRIQPAWVLLIVGVLTIVTASLMM